MRFIAIDPSLTCTGWAMFCTTAESLLAVGKIKAKKPTIPMAERLRDLQRQIGQLYQILELDSNDVLVCEAPTTIRDPRATLVVEQVRGLFETVARARGVVVPGRINPRSVQYEVMGLKGKQLNRELVKAAAVHVAFQLCGPRLAELGFSDKNEPLSKHQDIIDAVLLGIYGISKIKQSQNTGEPWESLFSQNAPRRKGRIAA